MTKISIFNSATALVVALCFVGLTGCGLVDMPAKMDKTNENMGKMIEGMGHTNQVVDKQPKLIAFENMLKAENSESLTPVPTRLMPFGEELALDLSALEMVKLAHLWLHEVNEQPDKKQDANGNDINFTPEEIAKINHDKKVLVTGLEIVAGNLPAARVQEMIAQQVYVSGEYESDVYALLMLRKMFIQDIFIDGDLLANSLDNVGKVEAAVSHNADIDTLAKLPFADRIKFKSVGLIPEDANYNETFDRGIALKNWKKISSSAQAYCKVDANEVLSGDHTTDAALAQDKMNRYQSSLNTIQNYLNSWGFAAKP